MKKLEQVENEYTSIEGNVVDPVTSLFCDITNNITSYVVNEGIKSLMSQSFIYT